MSSSSGTSSRRNASMIMADITAYGGGALAAITFLGPAYGVAHTPFIDYCTRYYGEWTALPASAFLFCLMAVMIAGITSIIIHTLIEIIRSRWHFMGSIFNFKNKGNYYD